MHPNNDRLLGTVQKGSYNGKDGVATTITLGFKPKRVVVYSMYNGAPYNVYIYDESLSTSQYIFNTQWYSLGTWLTITNSGFQDSGNVASTITCYWLAEK